MKKKYHFIGIGGSGMSSLAYLAISLGHTVSGSDRSLDSASKNNTLFKQLKKNEIKLFPQSGQGIKKNTSTVIVSTAIEKNNPDLKEAKRLKIPIISRATFLAQAFNKSYGLAVAGTNGKTTVSGLLSFTLVKLKKDPSFILGGKVKNYIRQGLKASASLGKSKIMVIEADESDSSINEYIPHIGIITNISKDHQEISALLTLFSNFVKKCKDLIIINSDCPYLEKIKGLKKQPQLSFGIKKQADVKATQVKLYPFHSTFLVKDCLFKLNLPGKHNVYNSLAVITLLTYLKIPLKKIAPIISQFQGMHRRLEHLGEINKITIIDDFAHNPEKIKASLLAARKLGKRTIAIFQAHGFAPTHFLKKEYIDTFKDYLRNHDQLYMPEIYYVGGTVTVSISAKDLIKEIAKKRKNSFFIKKREEIVDKIIGIARSNDVVLVMGARDPSLTSFAKSIKLKLKKKLA
ncbi:UDP-N-acetylmuramate--L-alanine ligase [Candidatus Auribacterota bacterium]